MKEVCFTAYAIRTTWFVLVVGLLVGWVGEASASYPDFDPPQLTALGTTQSGSDYAISVQRKTEDIWDENRILTIENSKKNLRIVFPFSSAYGRFHVYAPTLTNPSTPDIVLETDEGHGTGVTVYVVTVYRIVGDKLSEIYEHKMSDTFEDDENAGIWWYDISFDRANGDLLSMDLDLKVDWSGNHKPEDLYKQIPPEKTIVISWDAMKNQIRETVDGHVSAKAEQ